MFPVYLSFIPYLFYHFSARNVHLELGVLWFCSVIGMTLQMSAQGSPKFVIVTSILFLGSFD